MATRKCLVNRRSRRKRRYASNVPLLKAGAQNCSPITRILHSILTESGPSTHYQGAPKETFSVPSKKRHPMCQMEHGPLERFLHQVQMPIAKVPATTSAKPAAERFVSRSLNTIQANAMEMRMESLSICTTTLT